MPSNAPYSSQNKCVLNSVQSVLGIQAQTTINASIIAQLWNKRIAKIPASIQLLPALRKSIALLLQQKIVQHKTHVRNQPIVRLKTLISGSAIKLMVSA